MPNIPIEYKNEMIQKGLWEKIQKRKAFLRHKFGLLGERKYHCKECGNNGKVTLGLLY